MSRGAQTKVSLTERDRVVADIAQQLQQLLPANRAAIDNVIVHVHG